MVSLPVFVVRAGRGSERRRARAATWGGPYEVLAPGAWLAVAARVGRHAGLPLPVTVHGTRAPFVLELSAAALAQGSRSW